ncbi:unnamed protein product [Fraxinus pennsylvanica]|uniref:Calreticulin n=1 Tax=Fraxinus pennsylvanica TaxID=56036 RepID=A0AAD2E1C4_9LAMI|nr:unnamed protein product [Fraxinus pennsylvanica]
MKSHDFPSLAIAFSLLFAISSAEVFFEERFDDGWENRWVKSEWKKDENMAGEWNYTSGKWNGDPNDKDPEDKKPESYDDIPKEIPDPEAKKPEDWDDEEDGQWTAPTIPNPKYKGPWKPRKLKNPKGKWKVDFETGDE